MYLATFLVKLGYPVAPPSLHRTALVPYKYVQYSCSYYTMQKVYVIVIYRDNGMQWDTPVFATVWTAVIAYPEEHPRKTNSPAYDSCRSPTVPCGGIFRPQVKVTIINTYISITVYYYITQCRNLWDGKFQQARMAPGDVKLSS